MHKQHALQIYRWIFGHCLIPYACATFLSSWKPVPNSDCTHEQVFIFTFYFIFFLSVPKVAFWTGLSSNCIWWIKEWKPKPWVNCNKHVKSCQFLGTKKPLFTKLYINQLHTSQDYLSDKFLTIMKTYSTLEEGRSKLICWYNNKSW